MHDVVRLLTGSASDWLEDYFEHEAVKGFHASSSIIGSKVGPMSPGSGLVLLFHKMGEHDGHLGSWAFHKGGNGGFTQVLARAAEAFGAEIRLGSPVTSVMTQEGRTVGVALEDGTEFRAPVVVSALDPRRTFLDLVEPRELPADLVDNIERMKFRGVSAKVNFALDGLPVFPALPDTVDHYGGFLNIGPTIEYVERAFDAAKYGWYSERPFIDAAIQSVVDPDMAPPGKHVMSCFVQYAPYELQGQRLGDRAGAASATRRRPCSSRTSPGSATSCCTARWSRRSTSSASPGSPRATSSPASSSRRRCTSSGRPRAGASTAPRSTATTSAARAPTPAAA